jgi:N-acetylneuraminic acid mutarotase
VIIAGGTLENGATRDVYAFDPATSLVSRIGTLPVPLTHAGAATIGSYAYVVGGRGGLFRSQVDTVLAIDPASGRVTVAGHLPAPLSDASIAAVSGRILVAGGTRDTGAVTDRIYVLVPTR